MIEAAKGACHIFCVDCFHEEWKIPSQLNSLQDNSILLVDVQHTEKSYAIPQC